MARWRCRRRGHALRLVDRHEPPPGSVPLGASYTVTTTWGCLRCGWRHTERRQFLNVEVRQFLNVEVRR